MRFGIGHVMRSVLLCIACCHCALSNTVAKRQAVADPLASPIAPGLLLEGDQSPVLPGLQQEVPQSPLISGPAVVGDPLSDVQQAEQDAAQTPPTSPILGAAQQIGDVADPAWNDVSAATVSGTSLYYHVTGMPQPYGTTTALRFQIAFFAALKPYLPWLKMSNIALKYDPNVADAYVVKVTIPAAPATATTSPWTWQAVVLAQPAIVANIKKIVTRGDPSTYPSDGAAKVLACTLPAELIGPNVTGTCTSGGKRVLTPGTSCQASCARGFVAAAGVAPSTYSCTTGGVLNQPGTPLRCALAVSGGRCALPLILGPNVALGSCPATMAANSKCSLACASGFTAVGSMLLSCSNGKLSGFNTVKCIPITCELPGNFGTYIVGQSGCAMGGRLARGASCSVKCASGKVLYTMPGEPTTAKYTCGTNGQLTALPTLRCQTPGCSAFYGMNTWSCTKPADVDQISPVGTACSSPCPSGYTGSKMTVSCVSPSIGWGQPTGCTKLIP